MSEHNYKFNVTMTCGGCSGAVERVLKRLDGKSEHSTCIFMFHTDNAASGVKSYNVSLDSQTADIITEDNVSYETVLEKIKKTGKTVNSGEADGRSMAI